MIRLLDNLDKRHPVLVKSGMVLIAAICLYFAGRCDQDNSAALRWQMAAQQRSS